MPFTDSREQQAVETARSAAPQGQPEVPSWGPVLATTVKLWAARRRKRLRRSRRAWLIAICVLAGIDAVVEAEKASAARFSPATPPTSTIRSAAWA